MIWADRIGLVLFLPVILLALIQTPGGQPSWGLLAFFVAAIWAVLRAVDFVINGQVRTR